MSIRLWSVLRAFFGLLRASFKPEGQTFLPFEGYPSGFRPPMKGISR
jgi:hypothetical protein